ncbi:MAG: sigma-70 family RNA polymerase sigma factor [Chitinophagaceae bacterium]|nr:sigma-70 family RNA polymerase sigma factor [Chitinophagaceae bacterium]
MEISRKYTESELVQLLQQRNQPVFSYLYDNYSGALLSIILNIVKDETLANDVLQEVFVKIWKQINSYDPTRGRLFTWMLNIARNASIDTVRSKSYQQSQQNMSLSDDTQVTAGGVEMNTDQIGLRKIVHQLREEYRILIDLSYFQGFTQEEIAKMLEIPLGTVKTRLRTALIQLRSIIKP